MSIWEISSAFESSRLARMVLSNASGLDLPFAALAADAGPRACCVGVFRVLPFGFGSDHTVQVILTRLYDKPVLSVFSINYDDTAF